ncbi:putative ribosomal protein L32p [Rosa chinensis]|uniref:Large ribosomal subunit protein bL32m n=1 Tax=Rosa chinensis TaxID=74649 RepID=A0A2P6QWF8_ROSCH|nr:uncharacterized protein LOC112199849 [Rosa chinensis]PRQ38533.1 putative ribosomal protein L32p [Rosa chinensis]
MASKLSMLRSRSENMACIFGIRRWNHIAAIPPSSDGAIQRTMISSPPFALPEFYRETEKDNKVGFGLPSFLFGGSMELMAVPKRKTTPHKRGIRNGPKALKPVPVIIRCRSCGRVKLPHYYCCSGHRGSTGEREV